MIDTAQTLAVLREGTLEIEGRLAEASNTTLRAVASLDGVSVTCVYKPISGERPLWDFPDGTLAGREAAAYLVSSVGAGFGVVPPTVLRPEGPLGPGACQLWIDDLTEPLVRLDPAADLPAGWFPIASFASDLDEDEAYILAHADDPRLATMAVFDVVVNNADRKGGHVLPAASGLYGVDHGVCFHTDLKLRTVLWGWTGTPLPSACIDILSSLRSALRRGPLLDALCPLLTTEEITATRSRVDRLLARGVFPAPRPGRHVIPWPPL